MSDDRVYYEPAIPHGLRMAEEIERLRAALIAAMEIVQRERVLVAEKVKNGASPNILHWIDAVLAQADAALGREG